MNCIDMSVALTATFNEQRQPPTAFWTGQTVSSRLLDYEMSMRLHAMKSPARTNWRGRCWSEHGCLISTLRHLSAR
jgi:hypothetical protein